MLDTVVQLTTTDVLTVEFNINDIFESFNLNVKVFHVLSCKEWRLSQFFINNYISIKLGSVLEGFHVGVPKLVADFEY